LAVAFDLFTVREFASGGRGLSFGINVWEKNLDVWGLNPEKLYWYWLIVNVTFVVKFISTENFHF
jgi:hypothetical protein